MLRRDPGQPTATCDGLIDAIAAEEICKDVLKEGSWVEYKDFEPACFDLYDSSLSGSSCQTTCTEELRDSSGAC